jgi:hypothetical protein
MRTLEPPVRLVDLRRYVCGSCPNRPAGEELLPAEMPLSCEAECSRMYPAVVGRRLVRIQRPQREENAWLWRGCGI